MTFGYPNSLLIANDIEPAVLESLPAELRVEVLSQIQDQFEAWQAGRIEPQPAEAEPVVAEENVAQAEQP